TDPLWTIVDAPSGPSSCQVTTWICSPPGNVSCALTMPWDPGSPEAVPPVDPGAGSPPFPEQAVAPIEAQNAMARTTAAVRSGAVFMTRALLRGELGKNRDHDERRVPRPRGAAPERRRSNDRRAPERRPAKVR